MQSNNSPNQVPDAEPLFDADLMNLLHQAISPDDLVGLDELLNEASGAQTLSPTQMSSQVPSAQPLLTTQMGPMGQMVQLSSMKQMDAMGQMVQLSSTKQMVAMGQMVQTASTMQSGQTGQYDPSTQPITTLLMMQSPDASDQAASHVQTGGQASGGTQQDVLSENRRLHEENQKLLAENQKLLAENQKLLVENYFLNVGNGAFIKRVQEPKLKVQELKLKVKGQVCLHDEMSYLYMDVMKCLLSIWL